MYNNHQTNWQYNIIVNDSDKRNLLSFFANEYTLFTSLNNSMMAKLKRDPAMLTIFENKQRLDLFATLVQNKIGNINKIPEPIIRFKDLLEEKTITGKSVIDENIKIFFESAASKGDIHPLVRYNMAHSLLQFYCDQALVATQPVPTGSIDTHKISYQFIEVPDDNQKRHIQVPRKLIVTEWDEENKQTLIKSPYTRNPILLPKINLLKNKIWNYMIIHQRPGKYPSASTPWQIDVRKITEKYLINYLEISNPYFHK